MYVALRVEGDGNCFWRAVSTCIWGSQDHWRQVKLVVLGWAAANADALVGEGGILHKCSKYYSGKFHEKYIFLNEQGKHCPDCDNFKMMLLESVGSFCVDGTWGGDLTALLTAEALRIPVKFLTPVDMKWRREYDAADRKAPTGLGRRGLSMDDHRHSRVFVPQGARVKFRVPGVDGKDGVVREEIVLALFQLGTGVGESALADIPEVGAGTDVEQLNHFSAITSKDGSSTPFPLYKVAPPLFPGQVSA